MINGSQIFKLLLILICFKYVSAITCPALFPIKKNNEWGYINYQGKEVVPTIYSKATDFSNDVGIVLTKNGDTSIVNLIGNVQLFPYEILLDFSEELALAANNGEFFYVDKSGKKKFVLPKNVSYYDGGTTLPMASNFSEGIATIYLDNGSVLFIDKNGKTLFKRNYDTVDDFSGGISTVEFGDKGAVIDKRGRYILKPRIVDRQNGKIIFAPLDGIVRVQEGERKWKYFNNKGKVLLKTNFDYCGDFIDGLAKVSKNDKFGFINKKGKLVVPLKYDDADDFSDGLAEVEINNRFGFINNKGKLVIPITIFGVVVTPFKNGLAYIRTNIEEGYINKSGNWVWKKKTE
jgi:hypothetical protein